MAMTEGKSLLVWSATGVFRDRAKELLGLVASTVLRCDDCIAYHVIRSVQEGGNQDEFFDASNVALVVGRSITIPHLRRAAELFDQCRQKQAKARASNVD